MKPPIPSQSENPNGLHARYHVQKLVKSTVFEGEYVPVKSDKNSEYFVLRLDFNGDDHEHIKACRIAINAYANAIEHHLPILASDIKTRYPLQ